MEGDGLGVMFGACRASQFVSVAGRVCGCPALGMGALQGQARSPTRKGPHLKCCSDFVLTPLAAQCRGRLIPPSAVPGSEQFCLEACHVLVQRRVSNGKLQAGSLLLSQ